MRAQQRSKFRVDLILFAGFSLAFFLDLTGLSLHQFIGLGAGLLALYHLAAHWQWVKGVCRRLSDPACARPRGLLILDAVLFAGFLYIIGSGLVISTWLNLPLADYEAWRVIHIVVAALTMLALLVKLALHWRWIAHTAACLFSAPRGSILPEAAPNPGRREFLRVMGVTAVVGVFTLGKSLQSLTSTAAGLSEDASQTPTVQPTAQAAVVEVQPASLPEATAAPQPTSLPTDPPQPTATAQPPSAPAAASCVVRCPRGCSYPGRCRRYTDANQNGRCDLGECL